MNRGKLSTCIFLLAVLIIVTVLMRCRSPTAKIMWRYQPCTPEMVPKMEPPAQAADEELDTWSTDGVSVYLDLYSQRFTGKNYNNTVDPNNLETVREWWQAAAIFTWYMHSPPRYQCSNVTMMQFWRMCQDPQFLVKPPCLVYSFGIAYDFAFDDMLGGIGCDVRSFDPSMENVQDHRRSKNVQFYATGLSDRNTNSFRPDYDEYVKSAQKWRMRTLKSIKKELGHEGRVIDVLKIDIESHEWTVLQNLIETDMLKYVRQLLIEYHLFPERPPHEDYVLYIQAFTHLRQLGFREFLNHPHAITLNANKFRHQGEVYYVNTRFDERKL